MNFNWLDLLKSSTSKQKIRPILFLDIDGVLNGRYWNFNDKNNKDDIDPSKITILNGFVKNHNPIIYLCSSWRKHMPIEEMNTLLKSNGAEFEIFGYTPILDTYRGVEVQKILNYYTVQKDKGYYVIFDDDNDYLIWHKESLFNTDYQTGITSNVTYRASRYLDRFI